MTVVERIAANPRSLSVAHATARSRDGVVDAMRGIAILMVIGIHSLPQPLDAIWATSLDAALRPCVPVFLFVSGYLTALSGRVPLAKRLKAALIPYAIAFAAAYAYMALHNPAMDHRITTTLARFGLGYVFVYYYVFVYICCTLGLWLVFAVGGTGRPDSRKRIAALLILSIGCGLLAGSYLDPAISRLGASDALLDEVRMRDIPFWFSFVALGALTALFADLTDQSIRRSLLGAMLGAYMLYAAVRILNLGDAATYDSTAFFLYAALFCILLFAIQPGSPLLGWIGSGSYFIYLWHIFIVMALRDHTTLRHLGGVASFAVSSGLTVLVSAAALLAVRQLASPRLCRWLGA
ncbi:acyltransferase [Bradyrhizobium valentinum]|uniref:Acyltransferase n=2 Tax=Bradyrhizobium valentinum TaxID=1518501 RepID=A0A0R3KR13_9BRAD|nr:acyltransferase [Bradyrhizobium valentinum]KRR01290.1 acyltransferase [Bradyrhizobium valentinum]